MKILLAGATGVMGTHLVPLLVDAGHDVTGMIRSDSKRAPLERMGAKAVLADALDPDQVAQAVARVEPEAIIHQLTAIGTIDMRHFDQSFELTNRLRTEGTDHLLSAAAAVDVQRFIAQSYAGWPFARTGGRIKSEEDELDPDPPREMRRTLQAIRHLERGVTAADGVVLRYGGFYGPGTSMDRGGEQFELVRKRRFPIVGDGAGVWSFVHIADAAQATLAALERGRPGIYNIVDDDPAPVSAWLPALAAAAGAKPPYRVPRLLARLMAGEAGVVTMTEARGASNAKAKRELGWTPAHASWRTGFAEQL